MSHTDKTRPYWVKRFDPAYDSHVEHDHRHGECRVETLEDARAHNGGRRYVFGMAHQYNRCRKTSLVAYECTPDAPEWHHYSHWNKTDRLCWSTLTVHEDDGTWSISKLACRGHRRRVTDDSISCSCDNPAPQPTCWVGNGWSKDLYSSAPRWYRKATWYAPERAAERTDLLEARKLANAGELDDDFDCPSFQHRHRSSWYYW